MSERVRVEVRRDRKVLLRMDFRCEADGVDNLVSEVQSWLQEATVENAKFERGERSNQIRPVK